MKRFFLLITCFITFVFIAYDSTYNNVFSNVGGSPPTKTGSPGDGGTACAPCHNSAIPVTIRAGMITSDIPLEGYTPEATYIITATVSSDMDTIFGFQISPQNPSGTLLGSIALINATETKLVGSGKYITHTAAGSKNLSGTKTWTFNWTAPAAGTGDVTFYGAFNSSNGDHSAGGDSILTSTLLVQENSSLGFIFNSKNSKISIYPNPANNTNTLYIKTTEKLHNASLVIINMQGRIVNQLENITDQKILIDKSNFKSGTYFFILKNQNGITIGSEKVFIN